MAGNHEDRLTRALSKHNRSQMGLRRVDNLEGYPVSSIPHWLALDNIGYEWKGDYPRERIWLNDNICVSHSERDRTNFNTMINQLTQIEVIEHIHRFHQQIRTIHTREGVKYAGLFSFGALAKIDDTVPAKGNRQDWQQGLGVVTYSPHNLSLPPSIVPIFIDNSIAVFENKVFVGEDRTRDISEDISWRGYV